MTYRRAIDYACIKNARANFTDELKAADVEVAAWCRNFKRSNGATAKYTDMPKDITEKFNYLRVHRKQFHWHPHQLRHTRATQINEHAGILGAQVVMGHENTKTTQIYEERDMGLATRIMEEIG